MKEDNVLTLQELRERIDATVASMSVPHKRFADEYMANGQNGTQAYMAIFKRIKNGKIASAAACRIMKRHDIRAYIELCKQFTTDELLTYMSVSKTRVLEEEAKLAFFDVRKMFDINGDILPPKYWPEDISRAASGIDIDQKWDEKNQCWQYRYKIKFNDKGRALQRLETVLGMNKAPDLTDDTANLFKSFLTSIDGDSRGKLPAEMEDDE
jgi:phage terminase small subunit